MKNYREKLKNIKAFVFDYDGVLTNGSVYFDCSGNQIRQANVRDGYAMQLAKKKGFCLVIITGSHDKGIIKRCDVLNIDKIYLGVSNKKETFLEFLKEYNFNESQVLFMGDDIPDYELMKMAGISACPNNACEEIKKVSQYISHANGGSGCVRDVIEQVLKIQNMWMDNEALHW